MPEPQAIYLDHQATTPVDPRVLEAMLPFFTELYGNPASSQHAAGRAAAQAVNRAAEQTAALMGAEPRSLVWTGGATESNNLALKGALRWWAAQPGARRHLVIGATEHKSVLDAAEKLEAQGFAVDRAAPGPDGVVTADSVEALLREDTALLSVMWANNETGVINEIEAIGALCRQRGVWFHCDATQALGKVPVNVDAAHVDLLSASAHKLYGPKGAGVLFVRRRDPRVRLEAQLDGGGHQRGLRSGTLNVPGIVGLGAACAIAAREMTSETQRLSTWRDRLERRLLQHVDGAAVNGSMAQRLPHTTNLSLGPGVDAHRLSARVEGVALSHGSACTTGDLEAGYVLRRMGLDESRVRSSIRLAVGRFNRESEIDVAADRILAALSHLEEDGSDACAAPAAG